LNDLLPPAPQLRPYVEGYWQRQGLYEPEKKVRVVADACTKVIFELAPVPWHSCYILGTQLSPLIVLLSGKVDRIGVRFKPGMGSFFLGHSLDGLAGRFIGAQYLPLSEGEAILGSLRAAVSTSDRAAILDNWLLSRWSVFQGDSAELEETSRLSRVLSSGLSPTAAAAAMNMSERRLQRLCRKRFGASAAGLHRLFRFEALQKRLRGSPARLTDIAAELGFSDQAHMAREFRHFADTTISGFLRERALVGNVQDGGDWLPVLRSLEEDG
jgi:AraC-like DNA-binding protein